MLYVLNSRMFAYSAILLIAKFSTVRMLYLPVAVKLTMPPDVKIGTTIFSKKQKNKPHKVSHWVKPIGKPYAAYSYLF